MRFVELLRLLYPILEKNKTGQTEVKKQKPVFFGEPPNTGFFLFRKDLFLKIGLFQSVSVFLVCGFEKECHQQRENGYTGEDTHREGIVVKIGRFAVHYFLPRDAIVFEYAADEGRDAP